MTFRQFNGIGYIFIFFVSSAFISGCATVPKAEYRIEREMILQNSFDSTWESVLEAVKKINGNVINVEKESGLIVYSVFSDAAKSWIYANVYLKRQIARDTTKIIFIPKTLRGYCMNDAERDFFHALSSDSAAKPSVHRSPKKAGKLPPEDRFYDFEMPDATKIKEKGEKREFVRKSFDEVWDSLIVVAMQKGIIIKISKEKGVVVIASHPFIMSMLAERGNAIDVYARLDSIDEMASDTSEQKNVKLKLAPSIAEGHIKLFFEQLATEIYAAEKWKYLQKEP